MHLHNVHERFVPAAPEAVGAALDTLGGADDAIWPRDHWWPMELDRPLSEGAVGGHSDIRYAVQTYEPGRRVVFRFDPACGIEGTHTFDVQPRPGGALLRHDLTGRTVGTTRLLWPLAIRAVHDAVVEDAFDRVHERFVPGRQRTPWSPYVRLLRRMAGLTRGAGHVRAVAPPTDGLLAGLAPDVADSFAVALHPGAPTDVEVWRRRIFASPPRIVRRLLRLRDLLVRPLGLRAASGSDPLEGFPVLGRREDEVLMGLDDRHLDFRVSVRLRRSDDADDALLLTTTVTFHGPLGRLYFALIRPFHRRIVPAMLQSAVTQGTGPAGQ
ncbi:DUF2867 domain-containing protein [Blastococcus xanthinilyticus]|uniref:Uncharacterized protein DUF2867 n=1 Tax=Blastococcus xanthinilyticus TaxID=1564164 RepID=A0A5S5CY17_9ACTN|nr:DUF2867 domain-containing protein [Blastococcus xanthinilyticus]TYP87984.1 uncharacterized protein DUF2867 [Blastococcus xanthinilyticus]